MTNPIVEQLTKAITPIVSIGVGSAIWTVCQKHSINPESLRKDQLPLVKQALMEHYGKFWPGKLADLNSALQRVA